MKVTIATQLKFIDKRIKHIGKKYSKKYKYTNILAEYLQFIFYDKKSQDERIFDIDLSLFGKK